ncbi:MAG: GNAT family N-acetyltransferase [Bacteroidetes bacterium]|nr:GNAT family N-acetyltransferase [Bacteroidota bacterium]MCK5765120.1 GNAT family N-acetyltransferase [Bacteroidales bacterium]
MYATKSKFRFYRLKEEDIELVRHWRNHPSIQKFMVYREHITPEMQKMWFKSIDNINNLYFIVEYKGKKIGLINGKEIDWDKRTMESGIFIWDKYYRKTHIPTVCSMMFAEVGVAVWELKPTATILRNNDRALKYNKILGFKVIEDDPEKEYVRLSLEKENMGFVARKLKVMLNMLAGDDPIKLVFEKEDIESGLHDIAQRKVNKEKIQKQESDGDSITYYF